MPTESIIGIESEAARPSLNDLEGLVPAEVCAALTGHASRVNAPDCVVEIGSFKGKSACALALGARAGVHVFAIDPWELEGNVTGRFGFAEIATREAFEIQVQRMRLSAKITAIKAFSTRAAKAWPGRKVGLLYVDGDHEEDSVRADFEAWRPHLAPGATVIFDDLDTERNPGVRRAIEGLGLDFTVEAGRLAVVRV